MLLWLQDCQPLVLTHPGNGESFSFLGAKEVASGRVEAADAFSPLTSIGTGAPLDTTRHARVWPNCSCGAWRL